MSSYFHLLTNLFPPDVLGGYELLAADVRRVLQERGHRVTVVTTGTPRSDEVDVARVLSFYRPFGEEPGSDRLRRLRVAPANARAMRTVLQNRGRPDATLVMSLRRVGIEPLRAYASAGVPCVVTVNDDWPVAFGSRGRAGPILDRGPWARHSLATPPERVVYLSQAIRDQVRARVSWPAGRVQSQGIRLDDFPRRPFREVQKPIRLLFVGRVHPSKAPDIAIDALRELRARGHAASLVIAGRPVDADYEREIRRHAHDVRDHVDFRGHVDRSELPRLLAESDVFLFPSRWAGEAQGLTYMEAMATGVPVIAFPLGGAAEIFDAHRCGLRATRLDGAAFADAIEHLASDVELQRSLVDDAYEMLRTSVSLDCYVDVLEEELHSAAQEAHRGTCSTP